MIFSAKKQKSALSIRESQSCFCSVDNEVRQNANYDNELRWTMDWVEA